MKKCKQHLVFFIVLYKKVVLHVFQCNNIDRELKRFSFAQLKFGIKIKKQFGFSLNLQF